MASLTDRALILTDDIRSKISEEALDELKGESEHNWALVVIAFVLGAAVAVIAIVFRLRRVAETTSGSDAETREEPASGHALTGPTRPWEHWAQNARAGLSTMFRLPARS